MESNKPANEEVTHPKMALKKKRIALIRCARQKLRIARSYDPAYFDPGIAPQPTEEDNGTDG